MRARYRYSRPLLYLSFALSMISALLAVLDTRTTLWAFVMLTSSWVYAINYYLLARALDKALSSMIEKSVASGLQAALEKQFGRPTMSGEIESAMRDLA